MYAEETVGQRIQRLREALNLSQEAGQSEELSQFPEPNQSFKGRSQRARLWASTCTASQAACKLGVAAMVGLQIQGAKRASWDPGAGSPESRRGQSGPSISGQYSRRPRSYYRPSRSRPDYIESGRDPQDEIDRFAESQFPEPNLRQKFVDYARSASFRFKNLTQEELQFLKEEFTDPEPTDRTQLDDDMECFSLPKDGNGQIL